MRRLCRAPGFSIDRQPRCLAFGVCRLAALVSVRTPDRLVRSQDYKSINSLSYDNFSQNYPLKYP